MGSARRRSDSRLSAHTVDSIGVAQEQTTQLDGSGAGVETSADAGVIVDAATGHDGQRGVGRNGLTGVQHQREERRAEVAAGGHPRCPTQRQRIDVGRRTLCDQR